MLNVFKSLKVFFGDIRDLLFGDDALLVEGGGGAHIPDLLCGDVESELLSVWFDDMHEDAVDVSSNSVTRTNFDG